jgi:transposase-like protein
MSKPRKVSNELTLETRLEVIKRRREKGATYTVLAAEFNVNRATISRILTREADIVQRAHVHHEPLQGYRSLGESSRTRRMDQQIMDYLRTMKELGVPVTGKILQQHAREIGKSIYSSEGLEFTASEGWLRGFKRRQAAMLHFGHLGEHHQRHEHHEQRDKPDKPDKPDKQQDKQPDATEGATAQFDNISLESQAKRSRRERRRCSKSLEAHVEDATASSTHQPRVKQFIDSDSERVKFFRPVINCSADDEEGRHINSI